MRNHEKIKRMVRFMENPQVEIQYFVFSGTTDVYENETLRSKKPGSWVPKWKWCRMWKVWRMCWEQAAKPDVLKVIDDAKPLSISGAISREQWKSIADSVNVKFNKPQKLQKPPKTSEGKDVESVEDVERVQDTGTHP